MTHMGDRSVCTGPVRKWFSLSKGGYGGTRARQSLWQREHVCAELEHIPKVALIPIP